MMSKLLIPTFFSLYKFDSHIKHPLQTLISQDQIFLHEDEDGQLFFKDENGQMQPVYLTEDGNYAIASNSSDEQEIQEGRNKKIEENDQEMETLSNRQVEKHEYFIICFLNNIVQCRAVPLSNRKIKPLKNSSKRIIKSQLVFVKS